MCVFVIVCQCVLCLYITSAGLCASVYVCVCVREREGGGACVGDGLCVGRLQREGIKETDLEATSKNNNNNNKALDSLVTHSPATGTDARYEQSCHNARLVWSVLSQTHQCKIWTSPANYTDARYGQSCHLYRCQIRTVLPPIPMPDTDSDATYTDARYGQ